MRLIAARVKTVTTLVHVDPEDAFALFTEDLDLWWKRGPRYRQQPEGDSVMRLEAGEGGRLVQVWPDGARADFELGRVRIWSPPSGDSTLMTSAPIRAI